ncbi:MAG TPA: hypothetical protein VF190_11760 [Rhodothermales bacterium]
MRLVTTALLFLFAAPLLAQTSSFQLHGFLTARGIRVKAQPSWTEGGYGRFDVGGDTPDDGKTVNVDVAQLGLDWTPTSWMLIHADGVARREPSGTGGKRAGVVQAFADLYTEKLRLRAGSFWLPTSRENVDPLWNSRYTITYSAANSWIGQEVRPTGIDLQYSPTFYLSAGATAFRDNDTMGTMLAARGWTFGNRLSVYKEELPLPPPDTKDTEPIGPDLDHRTGYAGRIRLSLPERAMIQFARIDNRAELVPDINGYTPWLTRFNVVSADLGASGRATIAAEWVYGTTAVGFPGGSFTMDFDTAYILFSGKSGEADRWTVRVERFSTHAHNPTRYDSTKENGHAWTLAWFREVNPHLRTGIEYLNVKGERPGAMEVGFDPNTGGSAITLEVRYGF